MMNLTILFKQIFFLIIFLIMSFVLIHFLAIFGVFLALALPLLHLAFYPHIMCFWCKLKGTPHTAKHSIIDSLLVLFLTILSIPLVYLEHRILTGFSQANLIAPVAQFMIPSKSQYRVGTTFPLKVELMNIPAAINVVQADLSFDPSVIEVVDIVTDQTFLEFFVQKEFNNDQGYVRLTGGNPNPGYRQPTGLIATLYLRGKTPSALELRYLNSSLVLANDGKGTNLLADFPSIPLIITPPNDHGSPPNDLTIRNQIQGDKDSTILTFAEYADVLPQPFEGTLGDSTDQITSEVPAISPLLKLDNLIISNWNTILKVVSP